MIRFLGIAVLVALGFAAPGHAQQARIAVAANFTAPAEDLAETFAQETGLEVAFSFASTAQLYAQITQGAPFDAFLSADAATPARLIAQGIAPEGTDFTYALGRLVIMAADPSVQMSIEVLQGDFEKLAIADPATAPYGAAAVQVIAALGLTDRLAGRLVIGQSIAQAYQFVATGNAEFGIVAASQVIEHQDTAIWLLGEDLHDPIVQDAVLLSPDNEPARRFLEFVASPTGRAIIGHYGYGVPTD